MIKAKGITNNYIDLLVTYLQMAIEDYIMLP